MARTIKFATALETRLAVLIDAKVGSKLLLHNLLELKTLYRNNSHLWHYLNESFSRRYSLSYALSREI